MLSGIGETTFKCKFRISSLTAQSFETVIYCRNNTIFFEFRAPNSKSFCISLATCHKTSVFCGVMTDFKDITIVFNPDCNDPMFASVATKMSAGWKKNKPTIKQLQKSHMAQMKRVENDYIDANHLKQTAPMNVFKMLFQKRYMNHRKKEELQKQYLLEEENELALKQLQLDKEKAMVMVKRITAKTLPMMEGGGVSTIGYEPATHMFQIFVQDLIGKSHPVHIMPTAVIDALFDHVFAGAINNGIPREDCRLMTPSKELELGKTWNDQGVTEDNTVIMATRQRGGAKKKGRKWKVKRIRKGRSGERSMLSVTQGLFLANEAQLDEVFKKFGKVLADVVKDIESEVGEEFKVECKVSGSGEADVPAGGEEVSVGGEADFVPDCDVDSEGDIDHDYEPRPPSITTWALESRDGHISSYQPKHSAESALAVVRSRPDFSILSADHVSFLLRNMGVSRRESWAAVADIDFPDPTKILCKHCNTSLADVADCDVAENGECVFF